MRATCGGCSLRSSCHTLGCLEDARCTAAPGASMGLCTDVSIDLTPMSSSSCDWHNSIAPAYCWVGCPAGHAMAGLYRDGNDNLRGLRKIRCCQASALAPTLLSLASASPGVEATVLYPGQRLCSPTNCSYYLTLQTDGKLALYNQSNTSLWTSNAGTCDANPCTLAVQSNGSIAVYNRNNATFWSGSPFGSVGTGPFTLKVTDSGWPSVYDSSGNPSGDPPHQ